MKNELGRNDPCPCGSGKKYKRCCFGRYSSAPPVAAGARAGKQTGIFADSSAMAGEGIGYILDSSAAVPPARHNLAPDSPTTEGFPHSSAMASVARDDVAGDFQTTERPRDEWDEWYDDYSAADFSGKIDKLGALLAQDRSADFYDDLDWVGIVLDLEPNPDESTHETYIAFLEDVANGRPDVFKLGAADFVHSMVYAYVNSGREAKIAGVVEYLLGDDGHLGNLLFDLLDLLRLVGRHEECRGLSLACIGKIESSDLVPRAITELVETASFFVLDDFIEKGSPAGAFEALRGELAGIQFDPDDELLRRMIAHRSGRADRPFTLEELRGTEAEADTNRYLLCLDFGRWLCDARQIHPVAGDALQSFVYDCLHEMNGGLDCNPFTLREERLREYLRKFFSFLSMQQLRGIGTVLALRHFYDFLLSVNLIKATQHRRANRVLDEVGSKVEAAIGRPGSTYGFLRKLSRATPS